MAGNGKKALEIGGPEGDRARRRDWQGQAERRAEMYRVVENADAIEAELRQRVAARQASAAAQSDPLLLKVRGRGAEKARRARASQAEGLQRGRKALDVLNQRQKQAARIIRDSLLVLSGGMKAQDFTRVKVDGGPAGHHADDAAMGVLWADHSLRQWFGKARLGAHQIEVVIRIAGLEESISSVCLDFETDPKALGRDEASRETKAFVKRLFVQAMEELANVMLGNPNQCAEPVSPLTKAIRAWSKEAPDYSLKSTVLGERPDLARSRR